MEKNEESKSVGVVEMIAEERTKEMREKVLKNVVNFIEEFHDESDRLVAIVGTIKMNDLLEQAIRKSLLSVSNKEHKRLFDDLKPLSSFSSKVHLAYRLGLIDKEFRNALDAVRVIRNSFAHEDSSKDLQSVDVTKPLSKLRTIFKKDRQIMQFTDLSPWSNEHPEETNFFRTTISLIYAHLGFLVELIEQPKKVKLTMSLIIK